MKKQVLFTTGILISGLLAAQVAKKVNARIPSHISNISMPKTVSMPQEHIQVPASQPNKQVKNNQKTSTFTTGVIGSTYYDLQTNSSVADRIVVNADGSIAATWTMEFAGGDNTYPNRGTGYAYFDGTTWSAAPTARVEDVRVGWGNIVNTRSGKELILSHTGNAAGNLNLATRAVKGTGSWANSISAAATTTTGGNYWPRMISTGDTIYSLSLTYPVSQGGALFHGLDGAVVFSRSTNAGATWDITNVVPDGLDTTRFKGFGGDGYAIAANGSTVVVVAGDTDKDLTMSKSVDAGVTWTKTTIIKCPIKKWNHNTTISDANNDAVADTIEGCDGSLAIGLDNNNKAYVFYGSMRILQTTADGTGAYSYFPGTDGLVMWDETMPVDNGGVLVAAIEDLYQQGTIYFPAPAVSGDLTFGRWSTSLTSYPSVAFDASNTMYLSYSSIVDSLMSFPNSTKVVRHVYVIKSADGGATWTDPCDVVGSPDGIIYEGMAASMAKRVDGNVHLVYQRDLGAGNGIPGTTASPNPDEAENTGNNDIVYFKFPVSEIGLCNVDVGIKEINSSVSNLNFYPNPASTNGTIEVVLNENAKMDVVVLNAVGQTVYSTSVIANAGSNKVDVNLNNLSSGLYFYQVRVANAKAVTKKFVVNK